MSNTEIEQMKKIIEDKKKKSAQQGSISSSPNKVNGTFNQGFKKTKKAGSLNK